MDPASAYQSKVLDHLGLVAAMFDELELGLVIDRLIPQDFEQRKITVGQAVKAMVLNGLGFVNQRLYLVPHFFETKPTERLIAPGVRPEHLNDDTLGRALDALYTAGVSELFQTLAVHAATRLDLHPRIAHLDATSFHVDGTYNSEDEAVSEHVVHIRPGYSRDHRPELNQVVLNLIVEHQAGLPILMQPLSGNASDQGSFPALIQAHLAQLQQVHGFEFVVADAAIYSASALQDIASAGVKFITRVPETVKQAQAVLAASDPAEFDALEPLVEGYRSRTHVSDYGGVRQRWLILHSEAARERARKTVPKRQARLHAKEVKAFKALTGQPYSCRADAEEALTRFTARLEASEFVESTVLECTHLSWAEMGATSASTSDPSRLSYRLRGELVQSEEREQALIWRKSLFILATNECDEAVLSNADLLAGYKGQHKVERGFRFLKDPLFLASSLYVKSERRVMALLMVMTLCLLVYAALEWRIRQGLGEQNQAFPDQKGKPSARPTARWVFQSFVGIHVLRVGAQELVLNVQAHHQVILSVLGQNYTQKYASQPP